MKFEIDFLGIYISSTRLLCRDETWPMFFHGRYSDWSNFVLSQVLSQVAMLNAGLLLDDIYVIAAVTYLDRRSVRPALLVLSVVDAGCILATMVFTGYVAS